MNESRDLGVIRALRDHGDAGVIPRDIFIWIYGTEGDLKEVAAALSDSWHNVAPEPANEGWAIRAFREQPATEQAIAEMVLEIDRAIKGTEAIFDGWETSVERSN